MSVQVFMLTNNGYGFYPSTYRKGWIATQWDRLFAPDARDEYKRSNFTKWCDNFTGVSEHQKKQRAGMLVHEVVPRKPEPRNYTHSVEDWCDKTFGEVVHNPTPSQNWMKPKPFNYSKCW